jgi:chaperonin GroES
MRDLTVERSVLSMPFAKLRRLSRDCGIRATVDTAEPGLGGAGPEWKTLQVSRCESHLSPSIGLNEKVLHPDGKNASLGCCERSKNMDRRASHPWHKSCFRQGLGTGSWLLLGRIEHALWRKSMKIRPIHDRILAKRLAEEDKTAGGLFIPDTAKEKPLEARVIAVGTGKILENGKTQPLSVKVGDKVLIGKYTGSEVKLDGEDHIILREDDILAILDK